MVGEILRKLSFRSFFQWWTWPESEKGAEQVTGQGLDLLHSLACDGMGVFAETGIARRQIAVTLIIWQQIQKLLMELQVNQRFSAFLKKTILNRTNPGIFYISLIPTFSRKWSI